MADAVVTFLLENLSGRLQEEANFLAGVEDKVNLLIGELRFINIFLKNSQGKRNDEIVKEVVRQIRDVAHEAEDVIDGFISKVAEHRSMSTMKRIFRSPSHAMMLRNVGKKIVGIKEKINEIYNNRERYGIESVEASVNAVEEEEAMHRRRREVEEDDVVGFVHDSTKLVKQLTEEGDPKLDVISIIGMGGLGKTTLAKKIYINLRVTRHFNCHVWVCVSQDFRTRELLLKILKELGMELEGKSEDELKRELFKYLKGKRYIVVMDDIWRTEVWDAVRSAFPDDSNGSRILITSRNKEVALYASHTPPYCLPFLNKNESWELFSKRVFRGRTCPPELETLGRQIAEGCQGLPLTIVVLAGRLAKMDKSFHIWSKFIGDHVTSLLNRKEDTCQKILSLSYTDLPEHLKPCFLYFGIYPEDFEIPVRQLINLWVAEGFIQHTRHGYPEDDAEMYLEELIDRSLIQVASRRRRDGGVKTCRIHDLLRDLCKSEIAEEKFLEVHSDYQISTNNSRRLSIHCKRGSYMSSNSSVHTHARSLLFFIPDNDYLEPDPWTWLEKNFKLLRVLDFVSSSVLPKSIETFIHLRYLKLQGVVSGIPDSIGNLTNLVTLFVEGLNGSGTYLPKGIFKLHRLRNLYLSPGQSLSWDSKGALVNLQVLSFLTIKYDPQQHSFLDISEKFPNVKKLKIEINRQSMMDRHEVVSFPSLRHLAHLERLEILNCGMFAGNPNSFPSKVTKLDLQHVERVDACVTELGKLHNLRILKLHGNDPSDVSIYVTAYSFPQLQFLQLYGLKIKEWNMERSAMPRLTHLVIWRCHEFTSAPELLSLTTLQSVRVIRSRGLNLPNLPREVGH